MTAVAERVARGAALLDERCPGWWQRIDLTVLDVAHCRRCVLGQMFAAEAEAVVTWGTDRTGYDAGLEILGVGSSYLHGFTADVPNADRLWDELTAEWRKVIAARRLALVPAGQAEAKAS